MSWDDVLAAIRRSREPDCDWTDAQFRVLINLAEHRNGETGRLDPSLELLAEECHREHSTVVGHLNELERKKAIRRDDRRRKGGRKQRQRYELTFLETVGPPDTLGEETVGSPDRKLSDLAPETVGPADRNLEIEPGTNLEGGEPAKRETTPATVESPTPAWSADDFLAAFVAWVRAERNPTYALTSETRRELHEHVAGYIADALTPAAIAAGLKSWCDDPRGPGPIALPRHVDKAQRDPIVTMVYRLRGAEEAAGRRQHDEEERAERLVKALQAEGATYVGAGQWEVPEGVLPNPARAVAWLAAQGVTIE